MSRQFARTLKLSGSCKCQGHLMLPPNSKTDLCKLTPLAVQIHSLSWKYDSVLLHLGSGNEFKAMFEGDMQGSSGIAEVNTLYWRQPGRTSSKTRRQRCRPKSWSQHCRAQHTTQHPIGRPQKLPDLDPLWSIQGTCNHMSAFRFPVVASTLP